jgi:hypothetical protein
MQVAPGLLAIYAAALFILIVLSVAFVFTLKIYLRKMELRTPVLPKPEISGLSISSLHSSLQSQILELQATNSDLPEHEMRFKQLMQFLKESKLKFKAEPSMLDLYVLRLESLPHSDLGQLPTLAALHKWSELRVKEDARSVK